MVCKYEAKTVIHTEQLGENGLLNVKASEDKTQKGEQALMATIYATQTKLNNDSTNATHYIHESNVLFQ